jgi:hypothetical protein
MNRRGIISILCCTLAGISFIHSDWSYQGCHDISDANWDEYFDYTILVNTGQDPYPALLEPLKMYFHEVNEGGIMYANFYWIQRQGYIKYYDARNNTVKDVGEIGVNTTSEYGLVGLALDPDFDINGYIYVYYSSPEPSEWRISRFNIDANNNLNNSSEKIMITSDFYSNCCHSAGHMRFDDYGDLWMVVGKNASDDPGGNIDESNQSSSCERSSSSTADIKGSVIRIHPDDTDPKGYTIPKGNFGDYFALKYEQEGDFARAAEFRDETRVLPEIYAKGTRNPYGLGVDPVRRWIMWGENGVNRDSYHEEFNFTKVPGFFGYPYFAGNDAEDAHAFRTFGDDRQSYCLVCYGHGGQEIIDQDRMAPVNNSVWNNGLNVLPPAIPAIYTYQQSSAISCPIYRYDGDLQSAVKFPPHFDRIWFLSDFNPYNTDVNHKQYWFGSRIRGVVIDDQNLKISKDEEAFATSKFRLYRPLEMEFGPDGALYIINYSGWFNSNSNTSIAKITYKGDCHPLEPKLETAYYPNPGYGCQDILAPNFDPMSWAHDPLACATAVKPGERSTGFVRAISSTIYITSRGEYTLKMIDVNGKVQMQLQGQGPRRHKLRSLAPPGLYVVVVKTSLGAWQQRIMVF